MQADPISQEVLAGLTATSVRKSTHDKPDKSKKSTVAANTQINVHKTQDVAQDDEYVEMG